jgi:hypothetical protein
MTFQLGMHLTPSFAECCLVVDQKNTPQIKAFARYYTPMKSPGLALKDFLEKNQVPVDSIEKLTIASSFLEKILNSKIGGTVAQITTAGFEHWPRLRQNLQSQYLEAAPQRTDPLAIQDLLFPIHERIGFDGRIITPLDPEELDAIVQKLKAKEIRRVCINLLFSHKNQAHEKLIVESLAKEGFEIFIPNASLEPEFQSDEVSRWRRNVLNASLSGTFDEIFTSLQTESGISKIEFLSASLNTFQLLEKGELSTCMFAPAAVLASSETKTSCELILYLGLENWLLINPTVQEGTFDSPWGSVAGPVPQVRNLAPQPTQEFIYEESQGLILGGTSMGYEPGPMLLGRALKPMLFDLLMNRSSDPNLPEWLRGDKAKFVQSMQALLRTWKNTPQGARAKFDTVDELIEHLYFQVIDQIGLQTLLNSKTKGCQVLLTGYFAPLLFEALKKRWPEVIWTLDPEWDQKISSRLPMSKARNFKI